MHVPMMNIRPMHVSMDYWLMHMAMVVSTTVFSIVVLMVMMFIMFMRMSMSNRFMLVSVVVHLPIEEEHPGKHNQCSSPIFCRWSLSED